jgi:hypothetical protein
MDARLNGSRQMGLLPGTASHFELNSFSFTAVIHLVALEALFSTVSSL